MVLYIILHLISIPISYGLCRLIDYLDKLEWNVGKRNLLLSLAICFGPIFLCLMIIMLLIGLIACLLNSFSDQTISKW